MKKNDIQDLVFMSHAIGNDPAYVQGGGGNTSIKNNSHMAIKASGSLLKNMDSEKGYSIVDHNAIKSYLNKPDIDEEAFTKKIKSFVVDKKENRPSIETGFHAMLERCVIHTHSIYANLITCSSQGSALSKKLFPESIWIEYATPGRDLTLAIHHALPEKCPDKMIVFLQNHGLIVSAHTARDSVDLHEEVNDVIKDYYDIEAEQYTNKDFTESDANINFVRQHVLFPDQVVYTSASKAILNTEAAKETLWAYRYILKVLQEKGDSPHFLPDSETLKLLNMESEKFRQKELQA